MQHGKCCYCEQSIPDEGHAKAVEHFHPRSVFKGRVNEWKNLLLVCAQCNGKKSDKFPVMLSTHANEVKVVFLKTEAVGKRVLIDPSDVSDADPEAHIDFVVDDAQTTLGLPFERAQSLRGRMTIDVTGIDSLYHVDRRRTHYSLLALKYLTLLEAMQKAEKNGKLDQVIASYALLQQNTKGPSEYAAFSRAYLRYKKVAEKVRDLKFRLKKK
jgi:HNH endonuclease